MNGLMCALLIKILWNLDITKGQETNYVRYKKVPLLRGSFSYILLLLGLGISFVIPGNSLYRGSLNSVDCSESPIFS